ncbi:hypothetical protein I7I48_06780 [Histoplasma ohiense]|nr:hypothetical protein I7I48_06780 [Histoplasma ohiense (nom. inval.)]
MYIYVCAQINIYIQTSRWKNERMKSRELGSPPIICGRVHHLWVFFFFFFFFFLVFLVFFNTLYIDSHMALCRVCLSICCIIEVRNSPADSGDHPFSPTALYYIYIVNDGGKYMYRSLGDS